MTILQTVSGLVTTLVVLLAASGPQETQTQEAPNPESPITAEELPSIPAVSFVPFEASKNNADFLREKAAAAASLIAEAKTTDTPLDRADQLLAAANLMLAYEAEPACSRRFFRVSDGPETEGSIAQATKALTEARALLQQADTTLLQVEQSDDDQAEALAARRSKLDALRAFRMALGTYLDVPTPADDGPDARRAASELSPLLEHPDARIAAAAKFWQTCLRAEEDDPSPALSRLEPALLEPVRDARPYSFFARLLRCRLLAQEGHPATALSLLLQMEERCHQTWFPAYSIEPAVRTVALLRLEVLREWYDRLSADTQPAQRNWCAERMREVIDERFGDDDRDILRIAPAIPIVAKAPTTNTEPADEPPAETSPPGTN